MRKIIMILSLSFLTIVAFGQVSIGELEKLMDYGTKKVITNHTMATLQKPSKTEA